MADLKETRPRNWTYSCGLCKNDHPIKTCQRFLQLNPAERFDVVCEYFYCTNCLACSHTKANCKTDLSCQICQKKHNTLLHFAPQLKELNAKYKEHSERPSTSTRASRPSKSEVEQTQKRERPKSVVRVQQDFKLQSKPEVVFNWSKAFIATAQLKIGIPNEPGLWRTCRAGLNFYSPYSRVAIRLQSDLKLETFDFQGARFAKLHVTGRLNHFKWNKTIRALLTNDLPKKPYNKPLVENPTSEFSADSLADPDPRCNLPIDLELGAEEFYDLYRNGSINSDVKYVVAMQTSIGYVFTGPIGKPW